MCCTQCFGLDADAKLKGNQYILFGSLLCMFKWLGVGGWGGGVVIWLLELKTGAERKDVSHRACCALPEIKRQQAMT